MNLKLSRKIDSTTASPKNNYISQTRAATKVISIPKERY
jgi:hypothetical protein